MMTRRYPSRANPSLTQAPPENRPETRGGFSVALDHQALATRNRLVGRNRQPGTVQSAGQGMFIIPVCGVT
jgi:hypothetical protein